MINTLLLWGEIGLEIPAGHPGLLRWLSSVLRGRVGNNKDFTDAATSFVYKSYKRSRTKARGNTLVDKFSQGKSYALKYKDIRLPSKRRWCPGTPPPQSFHNLSNSN